MTNTSALGDQPAAAVVVEHRAGSRGELLHPLAQGVDPVAHQADGGVGRHQASARVVVEGGAAVAGGAAVGVHGRRAALAARHLRQAVAGRAVAVAGHGRTV